MLHLWVLNCSTTFANARSSENMLNIKGKLGRWHLVWFLSWSLAEQQVLVNVTGLPLEIRTLAKPAVQNLYSCRKGTWGQERISSVSYQHWTRKKLDQLFKRFSQWYCLWDGFSITEQTWKGSWTMQIRIHAPQPGSKDWTNICGRTGQGRKGPSPCAERQFQWRDLHHKELKCQHYKGMHPYYKED